VPPRQRLSALNEGIRADQIGTLIRVSTIYPGYIRTELTASTKKLPFEVDAETGCRALVAAVEREPNEPLSSAVARRAVESDEPFTTNKINQLHIIPRRARWPGVRQSLAQQLVNALAHWTLVTVGAQRPSGD